MGAFADQLAAFKNLTMARVHNTVRETVIGAGERLIDLSPIGAPETWKRKPPKDYVPGHFISNWNYSLMTPDRAVQQRTDIRAVNYLEDLPTEAGGLIHYISNSVEYGPALERGHSGQAPLGMVGITELELPQILRAAVEKAKAKA